MRWKNPVFCVSLLFLVFVFLFDGSLARGGSTGEAARLPAPSIDLELLATFGDEPIGIANAGDGSNRLFILGKKGRIKIFSGGEVIQTPFLDITDRVSSQDEEGLLGLAFHPDYANNGQFYVYYSDLLGHSVVSRFNVSPNDPNVADPDSEVMLINEPHAAPEHYGGALQFGPDGYLYIPLGDGGPGGDPENNAQDLEEILGKILRVDVDSGDPYGIPPTNPFVGVPHARPEIWSYGFRNPWRVSFDRATGDLYMADVGESSWEEVNFQPASSQGGENYGWRRMEGNHCFKPPMGCNDGSLTLPFVEYPHSRPGEFIGCAIIGGYVYRGHGFPLLNGIYFYGDWCTGRVWGSQLTDNGNRHGAELLDTLLMPASFGEDEAGEVYMTDQSVNGLFRIIDLRPFCDVEIEKTIYTDGDTVRATVRRLVNLGDSDATVRLRMGLRRPSGPPIVLVDKGGDGSFQILAGEDKDSGPQDLFTVTPQTKRGSWSLSCELTDPFTGELLATDDSPFVVQ